VLANVVNNLPAILIIVRSPPRPVMARCWWRSWRSWA
jgi:hypothetical protein